MSVTAPKPLRHSLRRVVLATVALSVGGLLVLTGCGPTSASGSAAPQGGPSSQQGRAGGGFGQPGGGNFVSGLIAAKSGKTLQVQGAGSQTAVTYTSSTRFSALATVKASAVKTGSCVMVQSAGGTAGATTLTASTVSVSAAVKGGCTRGGFGGARRAGRPGAMPSGAASGAPSGAPNGAPQPGASGAPQAGRTPDANGVRGVFGLVSAVSGSGFTVASTPFGTATSVTYTVSTTAATRYTEEKAAKASAAKVGNCATAAGKTDSTGAMTATTISLRPAVNGACTFGIRRPMGQVGNG